MSSLRALVVAVALMFAACDTGPECGDGVCEIRTGECIDDRCVPGFPR